MAERSAERLPHVAVGWSGSHRGAAPRWRWSIERPGMRRRQAQLTRRRSRVGNEPRGVRAVGVVSPVGVPAAAPKPQPWEAELGARRVAATLGGGRVAQARPAGGHRAGGLVERGASFGHTGVSPVKRRKQAPPTCVSPRHVAATILRVHEPVGSLLGSRISLASCLHPRRVSLVVEPQGPQSDPREDAQTARRIPAQEDRINRR